MNQTAEAITSGTARVGRFMIEADHNTNSDIVLKSIIGVRLRSRILGMRPIKDNNGNEVVPKDRARALSELPEIPGMRLTVDPEKLEYAVEDPLTFEENEKFVEMLSKRIAASDEIHTNLPANKKIEGVPTIKAKLEDIDQAKTLVRECFHLVEAGEARVVKGNFPKDIETINKMKGRYLLKAGCHVDNLMPRYEDQLEDYKQQL